MSEQTKKTAIPATSTQLFDKGNYMWMLIGLGEEVYSTTRITIAPMLIIAGFIIEIFAIMKKSKSN
jgi:hypothetical protein